MPYGRSGAENSLLARPQNRAKGPLASGRHVFDAWLPLKNRPGKRKGLGMRKKEIEKLEMDIAREKDQEVAERLKAILWAKQAEREEWKQCARETVEEASQALCKAGRLAAGTLLFFLGVIAWCWAIILIVGIVYRAVEPGSGPFPLTVPDGVEPPPAGFVLDQTKADLFVFYALCGIGTIGFAVAGWLLFRTALRLIRRGTQSRPPRRGV